MVKITCIFDVVFYASVNDFHVISCVAHIYPDNTAIIICFCFCFCIQADIGLFKLNPLSIRQERFFALLVPLPVSGNKEIVMSWGKSCSRKSISLVCDGDKVSKAFKSLHGFYLRMKNWSRTTNKRQAEHQSEMH